MESINQDAPNVNVPQGTATAPTIEAPTQTEAQEPFETTAEIFGPDAEEGEAEADSGIEWAGVSISLTRLAQFADCVEERRIGDMTCNLSDAQKMFAAIKTGIVGLEWIVEQFNETMDEEVEHHRQQVEGFLLLKVETTPKPQDESIAGTYWEAMEKLNAVGVGFGALLDYHMNKDGEVEDDDNR